MKSHLEKGCDQCSETLDFAFRVASAAKENRSSTPPAYLTAQVKSIFTPRPRRASWKTLVAELVPSTVMEPAAAGVRGTAGDGQHFLYRAGRYLVDLRLETNGDSVRTSLTGQIADRHAAPTGANHAPASLVSLRSESRIVAETPSNEFGEFCMDYLPEKNLRLFLELPHSDEQLEIPIQTI
jgi:hypothetical protein